MVYSKISDRKKPTKSISIIIPSSKVTTKYVCRINTTSLSRAYTNNYNFTHVSIFLSTAEDFTITPDSIVEPVGGKAEISCLYKPSPNRRVSWGVIKSGVDSVIFSGNTANSINVSADTKTLAFDPIIQSQEGNYYCWTAISAQENVYSKLVSLTILRKS